MTPNDPDRLLSDFIDDWTAGRRPRVRDVLTRVPDGPARDDLADRLETFLELAPTPAYDDATRAAIRAEPAVVRLLGAADAPAGLWPSVVPGLRERAGLSVPQVAARLVERFGLDRGGDEDRAADYLRRLEDGELEPARVSRRLLDALGALLGASGGSLADAAGFGRGLRPAAASGGALFRADGVPAETLAADLDTLSRAAMRPAPGARDELDRLFTGGPDG